MKIYSKTICDVYGTVWQNKDPRMFYEFHRPSIRFTAEKKNWFNYVL